MKALEYGRPAEWAAQQKWKRRGNALKNYALAALALIVVAALAYLALTWELGSVKVRVAIALIGAAVGGAYIFQRVTTARTALKWATRARIGVDSERLVRRAIRRQPHVAAVYGAVLGPRQGDCDLILVDPSLVVAAVEIKTGNGNVSVTDHTVRAGRKTLPRDPIGQTLKAARRLSESLGKPVLPVLCIPGMSNRPFVTEQGILVCSAKSALRAMGQCGTPAFASRDEVAPALNSLWQRHLQHAA